MGNPTESEFQTSLESLRSTVRKFETALARMKEKGASTTLLETRLHAVRIGLAGMEHAADPSSPPPATSECAEARRVLAALLPSMRSILAKPDLGAPQRTLLERRIAAVVQAERLLADAVDGTVPDRFCRNCGLAFLFVNERFCAHCGTERGVLRVPVTAAPVSMPDPETASSEPAEPAECAETAEPVGPAAPAEPATPAEDEAALSFAERMDRAMKRTRDEARAMKHAKPMIGTEGRGHARMGYQLPDGSSYAVGRTHAENSTEKYRETDHQGLENQFRTPIHEEEIDDWMNDPYSYQP